ncbi:PEP-CTERM sorting domain-containing protein [Luteolibacter sp. LG18]|uniref:PEP-CTERM sorting domain-containing protein n=1 Tax=Luteolibacter sp. LG18 TaxID=2819286 RepID=UPI002B2BBB33|nr:hypothetical protein llg_23570 [Luteolibacter sp. LG18]
MQPLLKNGLSVLGSVAMLLGLGSSGVIAATVTWGSDYASQISTSTGDGVDSSYTIEMGVFVNGFVPTVDNTTEWAANWRTLDTAEYDPINGYFTGTFDIQSDGSSTGTGADSGVVFSGMMSYVWVHSNGPEDTYPEWFLARSGSWVVPDAPAQDCCDNTLPVQWAISDLGNGDTPVIGARGNSIGGGVASEPGNYDLQTYLVLTVPEPSSLVLSLVSLGLLLRRRRPSHD